MTNYERIKNMSIEEIAKFLESTNITTGIKLNGRYFIRNENYIKQWLTSEVDEK